MRESRVRRIVAGGGTAVGIMIMEFGTRGIAKILELSRMGYRMMMGNNDVSHFRQAVKATVDNLRRHVQESTAATRNA